MGPQDDQNWEDILDERLGGKEPDKPVRLSDLAPPAGLGPAGGRGDPRVRRAAPEETETEKLPRSPDDFDHAWEQAAMSSDIVAELNEKLRQSEEARRDAQARVTAVQWELTELRRRLHTAESAGPEAQPPAGGHAGLPRPGGAQAEGAEVARLRRQLEEAHAIIRGIEKAYLAGERSRGGDGRSG